MQQEPTKERLARALHQAELHELAEKAERGDYDEIESEAALPLTDLACDLAVYVVKGHDGAKAIREALIRGEWDATEDEWEAIDDEEEEDDDA
jgi:hypothetical protein